MSLMERFSEYVRACFTGLWIESHEHQEALMAIGTALSSGTVAAGHMEHRTGSAGGRRTDRSGRQ